MVIAVPFDNAFTPAAVRLLNWCTELSGRQEHNCVLVVSRDTTTENIDEAMAAAHRAFYGMAVIKPMVQDRHKWPETPNVLFRTMCHYANRVTKQPFFWCEVDCVPLKPDWLDKLEVEYRVSNRPYMGFRRDIPVPHISGVAIYPHDVPSYNAASLKPARNKFGPLSFDLIEPQATLRHAKVTNLIHHEWGERDKPPTFPNKDSLKSLSADAVVFHRVKDGSLIDRLREVNRPRPLRKINPIIAGAREWLRRLSGDPGVALVYIHVPGDAKHRGYAEKFIGTYLRYPPAYSHRTIIVCQGSGPDDFAERMFSALPRMSFFGHDDSGWDIGAYIAVAKQCHDDIILCFGGSSFFRREGWMKRMVQAWQKHGPGFYGVTGTYEVSPHLNTSGFWCPPKLLAAYPVKVVSKIHRYEFEHGAMAAWKVAALNGFPVKLVTWEGEYDWQDWRKPANIFRRGNQSNILAYWHHCEKYEQANQVMKQAMARNSDTLTDPVYINLIKHQTVSEEVEERSISHFLKEHGLTQANA